MMSTPWRPDNRPIHRRAFLRSAAAAAGGLALARPGLALLGAQPSGEPGGLIARQRNPDNLEFPFASLNSFITPSDRFYVRSHFAVPTLEARTWRLRIDG